jgi:thiol-disulfide isomerase/thioredoxin
MFTNLPLGLRNALLALGITMVIIGTVVYAINYLDHRRLTELSSIQTQLATDTLSLETQFSLLETSPCEDQASGTQLSKEVSDLGARLSQAEERLGNKNDQVIELKKQYSLLQIRDYLLTKRLATTCHITPTVALYFYSNTPGVCTNCDKASLALSYLHEKYPALRVYAFDYDLDLGAVRTLVAVEKVEPKFPAFVINGKKTYGFTTLDEFQKQFPKSLFASSTTATSSVKKK